MRISDWSSDVCSSDLVQIPTGAKTLAGAGDDDAAHRPIGVRPFQATDQPLDHVGRKGVSRVGAVQGQRDDPVRLFIKNRCHSRPPATICGYKGPGVARAPCPSSLAQNASPPKSSRRSEEHTSELQSLMRISYAVSCLKKKK